jgi:hypothetical protein
LVTSEAANVDTQITHPVSNRRLRLLRISGELFIDLFTTGKHPGYEVIDEGIPDGTKVINVRLGWPNVELLLECEDFEPVVEGQTVPFITPVIKRHPPANDRQAQVDN